MLKRCKVVSSLENENKSGFQEIRDEQFKTMVFLVAAKGTL